MTSFSAKTVTLAWTPPQGEIGYRFYRDGTLVSTSSNGAQASVKFGNLTWAQHVLRVDGVSPAVSDDITVDPRWTATG